MVIVFDAKAAVTPAGKPVAAPIPVAPVVVCVIFVSKVLIQSVGVLDAAPAVLFALIVMLAVLAEPAMAGAELTTRMRYAVPAAVPVGIRALMVPAAVELRVPIFTGLTKDPAASLSCAVKTFPAVKEPVIVKGTLTNVPVHTGELTAPVVMVCENASPDGTKKKSNKNLKSLSIKR